MSYLDLEHVLADTAREHLRDEADMNPYGFTPAELDAWHYAFGYLQEFRV